MKSQPDMKVRRIAVFVGYGDAEMGTAWTRPRYRDAAGRERDHARRGSAEAEPETTVFRLEAVPRVAELQHAA